MTTHISYETAKMLKKALGDKAPAPMERVYYEYDKEYGGITPKTKMGYSRCVPMYGVCDLVGQGFCRALAKKHPHCKALTKYEPIEDLAWDISRMIQELYYNNGIPAVERALMEMMRPAASDGTGEEAKK